jgi:hypothetical protein
MRLLDHFAEGGDGEVGQLAALALEVGPQPFYRVEVGCVGGQALDHQPVPLAGDNACISLLQWAGRPSHSRVTFCPPRKQRSSPSTPIRVSVL